MQHYNIQITDTIPRADKSSLLLDDIFSTSSITGSSSGDQTSLLTWASQSINGRSMTNMLMVTTTVWMLDGIHSDTSNLWPILSLIFKFEFGNTSLKQWLIGSTTTGDDTDHGSADTWDGLSLSGWESDSSLGTVIGVTDDDSTAATGSGESSSVAYFLFNVTNCGTFWDLIDWKDVTSVDISYLKVILI